uniref:Zinc finger protein 276 n=1 Tax=Pelodiscus sinensis TaxID=13735 RepID=K7FST2_PELSI
AGVGRALSTAYCRLCHGKFSSRSLRNAFGKVPVTGANSEKQRRVDQVFFTDFQRLVGVAVQQDPALPQYVCKKCHAQFYKCRSILKSFIQRVNASPTGQRKPKGRSSDGQPPSAPEAPCLVDPITASPHCLHGLVTWTHSGAVRTGSAFQSQQWNRATEPGQKHVASNRGFATDLLCALNQVPLPPGAQVSLSGGGQLSVFPRLSCGSGSCPWKRRECVPALARGNVIGSRDGTLPGLSLTVLCEHETMHLGQGPLPACCSGHACLSVPGAGFACCPTPDRPADERVKAEFSDLSEGDFLSEEENEKRTGQSSDDSFEPYPDKNRASSHRKGESKEAKKADEPKIRKKPGPKPGWKKKIKCEREELPTIYKCPYQGCTAVYRGADGMKKHIKEHHEEVRERPCPHPGCNKVFMIDRYLQRHVKLIHTEVRNYICDECGQTFKQRKHLSVHQMRHSGAKPLQCEICGFQCRQRASLKYHMTKHKAEAELEFACDQCGKRFEKAHNLNVHMSMVHPLTQTQDKAKPQEPEQILPLDPAGTAESQAVKPELTAQQEPT